MIELEFDLADILAQLNELEHGLHNAVDLAMQECGEAIVMEESRNTKGQLSKSFFTYKNGQSQIIDSSKDYAQYVEYGRGPVRAINAKALRFMINGQVIFRKSVGPMRAQPFVQRSLKSASNRFTQIFDNQITKLIK